MKTRIKKNIDISYLEAGVPSIENETDTTVSASVEFDINESRFKPESKAIKIKDKKLTTIEKKKIRVKTFAEIIKKLPEPGERLFIIGGGNIDAIDSIIIFLDFIPIIEEMYIATWSMTTENISNSFMLFDQKKIKKINILISMPFRARYGNSYQVLIEGMKNRGQKIVCCDNHAKIILMKAKNYSLVVSGSANFTRNPRIEQIDLTNSEQLYNFNREWMESIFTQVYPENAQK